jgi:hypothetical protein
MPQAADRSTRVNEALDVPSTSGDTTTDGHTYGDCSLDISSHTRVTARERSDFALLASESASPERGAAHRGAATTTITLRRYARADQGLRVRVRR